MLNENKHFKVVADLRPRLADQLATMWGTPEVGYFITGLLKDIKGGAAQGFAADIVAALEHLLDLHRVHERDSVEVKTTPTTLVDNENFLIVQQRFERLAKSIVAVWGSAKCPPYINELLNDTREGNRKGFPPDVAVALFRLAQLHDKEYPELVPKSSDTWSLNNI